MLLVPGRATHFSILFFCDWHPSFGGELLIWVGGLDIWDPLTKGIVT